MSTDLSLYVVGEEAILSQNLVFYQGDGDISFDLLIKGVDNLNKYSYSTLSIISPNYEDISDTTIRPITNSKVKVVLLKKNIDDLFETGDFSFQITLKEGNTTTSNRITLPPFQIRILPNIKNNIRNTSVTLAYTGQSSIDSTIIQEGEE